MAPAAFMQSPKSILRYESGVQLLKGHFVDIQYLGENPSIPDYNIINAKVNS